MAKQINSSKFERKDNKFILQHKGPIKEPPIETKYKVVDCAGDEHNVYITKRNSVFYMAKDIHGNLVKRKVAKGISDIILKELKRI